MKNTLDLKFLGPPEIVWDGKALKFATRKALALFAYLVVETGAQPREKLMSLFWPESETHLAQSALRNTLARIKEALRGVYEPLQIAGDRVGFNPALACSLDLERVAQAAEVTLTAKIAPATIALLQRATQVARGPFMEGLSLPDAPAFDEWLTIQRANWGHRQNLIYDRFSLHQLENHLIQPATETVIRWLIVDPLNEVAYQRLMRLHFLNGDRSAALQTYETCRSLLARELDVKPSAATQELLAVIQSAQTLAQTPAPAADPDMEAREPLHIPFVGRSNEYQGLVQSFRLVKKGKPQIVVVSGESGIGKTRLSDEFLKWAVTEGADVLRGHAFVTSGHMFPYHPIIEALHERLERENAPDDLLDDARLAELARILPELRERYPDLPLSTGDDSTARTRLFEAIARLAEALSARKPLVWLMDDLQWADAETLELLYYLSHNWRPLPGTARQGRWPILLLILMRSEALGYGTPLREWTSRLTRDITVTRFSLSPVQAADIQEVIQALAGENARGISELSAWFTAETAGQPFFLTETLAALNEYSALVWEEGKLNPWATLANLKSLDVNSLAPAIHDVVFSRLEWLSQSASAMLSAAAVLGRNCSFELLSQVSGMVEQESLNALDELLSARLILEIRNESRPYTISHDRIREIVYTQLSAARQQIFHRRALAALTEQDAPSAELAHHALSAREWQLAFQHSLSAGDEAMRLYALAGAVHHYETSRSLLNERKAAVDHATCQRLYTQLGNAYEMEFQPRKALDIYEEMQAQASARNSRAMKLAALVARSILLPQHYDTQDVDLAKAVALEALPLAQELDNLEAQAQIELSLAWIHKFGHAQIEPVILHLRTAEELARKAGAREQTGLATLELGVAFLWSGQLEQAEAALLESVKIYRELDQRYRVVSGLHNLATTYLARGQLEVAFDFMQEAYRATEALGSPTSIYALAVTHNVIHILRGEYHQAFEALSPGLGMDESQIVSGLWIDIFQQLAWCYYDLGDYAEGVRYCQKAIWNHGHVNSTGYSAAFALLTMLKTRCGDLDEAETTLRLGWENFDLQSQNYAGWWETHSILAAEANFALAKGELARAARCIEQLLGKYDELNLRHFRPGILLLSARVELAAGKKEEAYQTLSTALRLADEMGEHREVWEMCAALGNLEGERGNEWAAIQWKERACQEAMLVARQAGTLELREIFLSRPEVRSIVETDSPT